MGTLNYLIFVLCVGGVFGTECSQHNRTNNLSGCLQRIKDIMYQTDVFWFGTDYSTNCPTGPAGGITCANPQPGAGLSVASRILPSGYNASLLTKFIKIEFTSEPGQYTGCGNTFTSTETLTYDIDPSSSQILTPWYVRQIPQMTWDAVDGEYYSIYVYDVGNLITHGIYINIQGNNIPTSGENVIDAYHGPLRSTLANNPYIFMLFKQSGYLNPVLAMEWYNVSHVGMASTSHIPGFMSLLNMTGPIAANWIVVTGDEYAAQTMYSFGIVVNCPLFIGKALDMKPRPFLPSQSELSVLMDVAFDVEELSYSTCCNNYTEQQRKVTLNPIGNELLSTSTARSGMRQTITMEKMGFYALRNNFTGEMFTMIALDPDVPIAAAGNESHPLLHQMQINIMGNNFSSGEEVIPWNGPYPPNDEPHYYYFLLYKHTVPVNRALMLSYAGNCSSGLTGRCLYDINSVVSDNGFVLVGASWFRSVRDSYVIYRNIQRDPNTFDTQCTGQPGYTWGCEVFTGECSQQNRANNLTDCLMKIKEIMYLPNVFWFGTDYATDCPNGPAGGITCANPQPGTGLSVATRILSAGYDDSLLTKFLTVKFTSDPGQYTGCGNTFTSTQTVLYNIDPSSSKIVTPWYVRHTPEVTWDSVDGEYYSIYVYDTGYLITHAVYINIQGNNIPTSGENVIDAYHGPLRSTLAYNPYVFMLFKQSGYLDPILAMEWYNASHVGMASTSHIPGFMSLLNMTGPIAVNWILATGDEYAAQTMYSRGIVVTCPIFIGRALDMKPRPFLPSQSELTVLMDVTFGVDELAYSTCCRSYNERQRSFTLNPIGNELLPTSTARSGMRQTITMEKVGLYFQRNFFGGEMFTMIALDPDVPIAAAGNESHPLLHQMQINIMGNNFTSGEEVIPWNGPYPPNDEPHYYYFLLYKHMAPVNRTRMLSYAGNCFSTLIGRCLYDINTAVSENGFVLVGASWFRSERDSYVIYRNIRSDPSSEVSQCTGQPGYTVDCEDETSAGNTLFHSISLSMVFVVLFTIFRLCNFFYLR